MTDYNKLTVVKLKEELKRRGLAQAGLKAALVARLEEDDSAADNGAREASATHTEEDGEDDDVEPPSASSQTVGAVDTKDGSADETVTVMEDTSNDAQTKSPVPEHSTTVPPDPQDPDESQNPSTAASAPAVVSEQPSQMPPPDLPTTTSTAQEIAMDTDTQDVREHTDTQPVTQQDSLPLPPTTTQASQSQAPFASQTAPSETQTSIDPLEQLEDTRKRKRRSLSPAPLTQDIAIKKLKGEGGSPQMKLDEDAMDTKSSLSPGKEEEETKTPSERSPSKNETVADPNALRSPMKTSMANARFKGLFAPASSSAEQQPTKPIADRDVAPAKHAATSALYIRNLMRPLQVAALQEHLSTLVPSGDSESNDVFKEFFVDSIKSHALVQFHSIDAAVRVRAQLHDMTWPDEKNRKPLWVDFVPEAKLATWIQTEQDAAKARPPKRWEVAYEEDGGTFTAYLQEADASRNHMDDKRPTRSREAPSKATAPPTPKGDPGRGFRALDDLFRSTTAKPKLYFLPVPPRVAQARLSRLAAGRGGGRDGERRRFTFEEDQLVDDGPEFRPGYRGGGRIRGGGGGRGGMRGDSYRGR